MMETLSVTSENRVQLIDITNIISSFIREKGWENGAVILFVPHTTAGITINEGADPAVQRDIAHTLSSLVPFRGEYRHAEGNSDAHIKTVLTGTSALVILKNGHLQLGTWQSIFFCEYDGPRTRKIWIEHIGG